MAGNAPRGTPGLTDLLVIGGTSALCLLAGLGLGWLVDSLVHTFPVFALVGLALGIAGGCFYGYSQFRSFLNGSDDA
jgi:hypothetical protein